MADEDYSVLTPIDREALRDVMTLGSIEKVAKKDDGRCQTEDLDADSEIVQSSIFNLQWKKMPQGVKDSIDAVGAGLTMPVVTAICPCIGALATV